MLLQDFNFQWFKTANTQRQKTTFSWLKYSFLAIHLKCIVTEIESEALTFNHSLKIYYYRNRRWSRSPWTCRTTSVRPCPCRARRPSAAGRCLGWAGRRSGNPVESEIDFRFLSCRDIRTTCRCRRTCRRTISSEPCRRNLRWKEFRQICQKKVIF